MIGTYFVIGLLGLLAVALGGWVIAGEVSERRQARAAARFAVRGRPSAASSPGERS